MEFCDEFDDAAAIEGPEQDTLLDLSRMFHAPRGQAGFRLDTYTDLMTYFARCIRSNDRPDPREIVFTLLPWARKGPNLRSRPVGAPRRRLTKIPSPSKGKG